jgi:hypothetical protein
MTGVQAAGRLRAVAGAKIVAIDPSTAARDGCWDGVETAASPEAVFAPRALAKGGRAGGEAVRR